MLTDFKDPTWAHIELFGHKTYFGRIQEVTRFGVVGAAIEPMTAAGFAEMQFRGGAAIYGATPMSEEDVRRAVMPRAWRPCESFKASVALPDLCLACGRNEPEHREERDRIAALPPPAPIADAEVDEDGILFDDEPVSADGPPPADADTLRVAEVLGIDPRSVVLCWDGGDEIDPPVAPKILDITIARRYRPHRSAWQRLIDAGLPIYRYDDAALSWSGALGH